MASLTRSRLTVTGAALALAFGAANADAATWDMPNEYNPTSIQAQGNKRFAEVLKEKTNGEIEIVHHFGGSLGYKSQDQFDAVGDGAVPIADTFIGPLGGFEPLFLLPSLPFLTANSEESRVLYEVAKPYYERIFEDNNQKLLFAEPWPPSGIWAKKPVAGTEDLKNLKIRSYDTSGTITLREAGAAPIQLSWADVVPQLGTGGIEAVLTSAEGGANAKFWEHLSDFTEINYAAPLNLVHMNLDVWNELSPEHQQAVLEAAAEAEAYTWELAKERVAQNYEEMRGHGMTITTDVPPEYLEALAEASKPALDDWLAKTGEEGRAILEEYRRRTGKEA
ncbi:MAG TPA: TRAP transporter substrate-binding protein [Geminicoccaceae bacterium]|nr:TRAP transporter substrate-binding protein [Geminicoccaceae bacterium]